MSTGKRGETFSAHLYGWMSIPPRHGKTAGGGAGGFRFGDVWRAPRSQESAAWTRTCARLRRLKPMRPKPAIINAQVAGSGTAAPGA